MWITWLNCRLFSVAVERYVPCQVHRALQDHSIAARQLTIDITINWIDADHLTLEYGSQTEDCQVLGFQRDGQRRRQDCRPRRIELTHNLSLTTRQADSSPVRKLTVFGPIHSTEYPPSSTTSVGSPSLPMAAPMRPKSSVEMLKWVVGSPA